MLIFLFAWLIASPDLQPDTLVVCPRSFQSTLSRWVEYRESQGYRIRVVEPPSSAYQLNKLVRETARPGKLRNLVLIGDANGDGTSVPTDMRLAQVNFLFGSDLDIPTDNTYADINQDGIPDLTIGRLPVDSNEQLDSIIDRIIRYENELPFTQWRRRINVVAGVGGFGTVVDKSIENAVKILLSEYVPSGYDATMTYGSWTSPYCPSPKQFGEVALDRLNEGCLYWVYVGHGQRHRLDSIRTPIGRFPIMDLTAAARVTPREGSPIAVFFACSTGAFDDRRDSIAETMLNQPTGPIAAICGTRVTMPTGMGLLSLEIMDQQFHGDANTLGQLLLIAKQQMLQPGGSPRTSRFRELIAGTNQMFSPRPDLLFSEIKEHIHLFHLLGDPLLRLDRPTELALSATPAPRAGEQLEITGRAPFSGTLSVDVSYTRGRLRHRPMHRERADLTDQGMHKFDTDYLQAINLVCVTKTIPVSQGEFICSLDLPSDVRGSAVARAFLSAEKSYAIGVADLEILAATARENDLRPATGVKQD